jgi:putative tryptophan/tyrosine transport system substrate-binding protein
VLVASFFLAAPLVSFAQQQQPPRIARIGFLGVTSASLSANVIRVGALRTGLRDLGYVEGKNLTIEFRWAEGRHERLPALAAELVGLKVDVIVAQGTQGTSAAKQATATIPIVMPVVADPVDSGLVASLARSGGNITGLTWFSREVSAKRLELLKDAVPRTKRVAVLSNPDNSSNPPILQAMELAARSLGLELQQFQARGPNELESAFAAMAMKRVDAVTINRGRDPARQRQSDCEPCSEEPASLDCIQRARGSR